MDDAILLDAYLGECSEFKAFSDDFGGGELDFPGLDGGEVLDFTEAFTTWALLERPTSRKASSFWPQSLGRHILIRLVLFFSKDTRDLFT